ncbi:PD-(D/E)XK nuclease family protein [Undibacterium sp. Jales W-56]|uniref:PD-(D/E)XK nuclease family protein n=1 Tax=Undibacterium sp. Jales W-56 TaxID=2897325 RepID=UPI0021CFB9BF|nr:PD-(D/E)XK nuclease family protein [Undibacterium sp. Jales W-56]MCU6432774.1 PD-(D/E)XK nuclease family protein [Undibacterium sp. Jales W-56]
MRNIHQLIPASGNFWQQAAAAFLQELRSPDWGVASALDLSALRVVVPTFEHAQLFLKALSQELHGNFIPPRINTMFAWVQMLPPQDRVKISASSERLMGLYAELRQHAWLKKLFTARRNTDLLPLAQTLLNLSDELTQALLPAVQSDKEGTMQRWHAALAQLSQPSQKILSEEAQLVWTIWQSQLDERDAIVHGHQQWMRIAQQAQEPLVWISPTAPDAMERAFLDAYAKKKKLMTILLDWRPVSVPPICAAAWPNLFDETGPGQQQFLLESAAMSHIRLCEAASLEDEAQQGAQTIVDWLVAGHQSIAVIAQDRAVARRIRALLERANVLVADETGWKLSTTRAAAAIAAWFEVVASKADTMALIDLLKSPYLPMPAALDAALDKSDLVMQIELGLRRANVLGGWDSILSLLESKPDARQWIAILARQANQFSGRKNLSEWSKSTLQMLFELGVHVYLQADSAGSQIVSLLQALIEDCQHMTAPFSFSEWRAFINLQLENAPYISSRNDKRVFMLPLNGARLRRFDAVLLVGADAAHLPSQAQEVLFFTNAVRRECGLITREQRQQQQLRDFTELLLSNPEIVLSWQGQLQGEHNPVSPWLAQLDLALERTGQARLGAHHPVLPLQTLNALSVPQPKPAAAMLAPATLSASGYSSLIACPYQFFARRMLKLDAIDELSDMPEKRDYGDWLHAILKTYHDRLATEEVSDRVQLLSDISTERFNQILQHSPAALGYSVRWAKVIPSYVAWADQREADGWRFELGEEWREHTLDWNAGGQQQSVTLRGRIDRIDINAEGERAVLDYKTKPLSSLSKRLKDGEDQQLPFYGLLANQQIVAASYVGLELERGKIGEAASQDFKQWTDLLEVAIKDHMHAIRQDAALPAQGTESVCQYCEMRGLCRKGAW